VFDDFTDDDDEQSHNLLGSLQLEADGEPVRRGASRANSVRFDVSALQGSNWAHSSRNSGDFGPIRPTSGFGSHPMTERSMSHKSDGRHSSAGHSVHSVHSGRTSSLGLDTNFLVGDQDDDSSLDIPDPPPGLFILGPVPSIIRCWLTKDFSHSALLYADICSGTPRSVIEFSLVKDLGLVDQVVKQPTGRQNIKLPVYLPEAIITQAASRSSSPAPQLPILTADFEIVGLSQRTSSDRKNGIRVFMGSDTLRAHNADILLSQNLMTLYGDDRNKLSVPFVRPEDETIFKNLCTSNIAPERNELKATAPAFTPVDTKSKSDLASAAAPSGIGIPADSFDNSRELENNPQHKLDSVMDILTTGPPQISTTTTASGLETTQTVEMKSRPSRASSRANGDLSDTEKQTESANLTNEFFEGSTDMTRRESVGGTSIWGSWRQGTASNGSDNGEPTSGYQRATRGGKTMKVLRPSSKSIAAATSTSRSSSAARTGAAYEPGPARPSEPRRKSNVGGTETALRWESKKPPVADEHKGSRVISTIPRSSNPVGGASAFSWMAPPKASVTSAE